MDKDIKDTISTYQDYIPTDEEILIIGNLNNDNNNSEDDMFIEIIRANSEMGDILNKEEYDKILEKLEGIRPLLSEEQNEKLNKVFELLNKEE